ncbi:hypothetical protein ACFPN2_05415, partial [Steroidobacter flavus]
LHAYELPQESRVPRLNLSISGGSHQQIFFTLPQFATSRWGGRRKRPFAFTEHGAIMAATILNSPRAVAMTIHIVRAFLQLRHLLSSNKQLAEKFAQLEKKVSTHDQAIVGILKAIRELMRLPEPKKRPIGFTANLDE